MSYPSPTTNAVVGKETKSLQPLFWNESSNLPNESQSLQGNSIDNIDHMKTGRLYLWGIKIHNCFIRLEPPVAMFVSGSGWNGASLGHGCAVLSARLLESCFYKWEENHTLFWALVFVWWSKFQVLLNLGIFAAPPSGTGVKRSRLRWSWSPSSHVFALHSQTRKHNIAKTLLCVVPNLQQQLHPAIKQKGETGFCPEWLPSRARILLSGKSCFQEPPQWVFQFCGPHIQNQPPTAGDGEYFSTVAQLRVVS